MMRKNPFFIWQAIYKVSFLFIVLVLLLSISSAQAASIKTDNRNLKIRWDNTVKYSAAFRLKDVDERVAGTSFNPNLDDGDRNFDKGLISNRLDLLSEFDLRYKRNFGTRISGAAWYDDIYNKPNDNNGDGVINSVSVGAGEFTEATERLHGRKAELLDFFVYGTFNPGNTRLSLRAGQFNQIYGESLFFGGNAIAAAQSSPDIIKATSVPGSQIKEILMPVEQISAQWQLNRTYSIGAYYQFDWRKARLPASGSYFSLADFPDVGGERIFTPAGTFLRGRDLSPSDSGQFGIQLKGNFRNYELGLYAAQYHEKFPQFYVRPDNNDYVLVYGEEIRTIGTSLSTSIGDTNIAAELSYRDNQPLVVTGNLIVLPSSDANADGDNNPAYPVGETLHFNTSFISLFGESALWDGGSIVAELAYNRVLDISENEDRLDPNATKDAAAIRFSFTPGYYQVIPHLTMEVPISVGYGIHGRSSVNASGLPPENVGDVSIGLKADYRKVWFGSVNYTHFFGDPNGIVNNRGELSYDQPFRDRDFISLTIQRTF